MDAVMPGPAIRAQKNDGSCHSRRIGPDLWHCLCLPASETALVNAEKARDPKDRRRVLILMSDTGGGHRASAEVNLLLLDSFFHPWQLPHVPCCHTRSHEFQHVDVAQTR